MSDFEIDFEWPVAKYDFRPATAEEVAEWRRGDRHRIDRHLAPTDAVDGIAEAELPLFLGRIFSVGEARRHRPKAETMERAVRVLVECKQTPFHSVALKVVQALGQIRGGSEGDRIMFWFALAHRLRAMFEGKTVLPNRDWKWPHPGARWQGNVGIYLVPGANKKPMLAIRPNNLDEALVLYAARMIATGTTFNICENCKTPFLSGGARGRNKRSDSRFCSSECRWKHHNETRREARMRD
jgi:hypothetical protein